LTTAPPTAAGDSNSNAPNTASAIPINISVLLAGKAFLLIA
jgi:hypothetical protein